MIEIGCPWCESRLVVAFAERDGEQSCPECQTTWSYEEIAETVDLPAAA